MRYKVLMVGLILFHLFACRKAKDTEQDENQQETLHSRRVASRAPEFDPNRGIGAWNEGNLSINTLLEPRLSIQGEKLFFSKCSSCHKLSNEKLNGPGFKGLTERRSPYWIMNFLTQPNQVLNKDSLEIEKPKICQVRLPNQILSDGEARALLEFFRKKDGLK